MRPLRQLWTKAIAIVCTLIAWSSFLNNLVVMTTEKPETGKIASLEAGMEKLKVTKDELKRNDVDDKLHGFHEIVNEDVTRSPGISDVEASSLSEADEVLRYLQFRSYLEPDDMVREWTESNIHWSSKLVVKEISHITSSLHYRPELSKGKIQNQKNQIKNSGETFFWKNIPEGSSGDNRDQVVATFSQGTDNSYQNDQPLNTETRKPIVFSDRRSKLQQSGRSSVLGHFLDEVDAHQSHQIRQSYHQTHDVHSLSRGKQTNPWGNPNYNRKRRQQQGQGQREKEMEENIQRLVRRSHRSSDNPQEIHLFSIDLQTRDNPAGKSTSRRTILTDRGHGRNRNNKKIDYLEMDLQYQTVSGLPTAVHHGKTPSSSSSSSSSSPFSIPIWRSKTTNSPNHSHGIGSLKYRSTKSRQPESMSPSYSTIQVVSESNSGREYPASSRYVIREDKLRRNSNQNKYPFVEDSANPSLVEQPKRATNGYAFYQSLDSDKTAYRQENHFEIIPRVIIRVLAKSSAKRPIGACAIVNCKFGLDFVPLWRRLVCYPVTHEVKKKAGMCVLYRIAFRNLRRRAVMVLRHGSKVRANLNLGRLSEMLKKVCLTEVRHDGRSEEENRILSTYNTKTMFSEKTAKISDGIEKLHDEQILVEKRIGDDSHMKSTTADSLTEFVSDYETLFLKNVNSRQPSEAEQSKLDDQSQTNETPNRNLLTSLNTNLLKGENGSFLTNLHPLRREKRSEPAVKESFNNRSISLDFETDDFDLNGQNISANVSKPINRQPVSITPKSDPVKVQRIVNIAILAPMQEHRLFTIQRTGAAIEIALERVVANTLVPRHVRLLATFANSYCSISDGINEAIEFYARGRVDVFLGPTCDYAVAPVARQVRYWRIPLLTPGAMAADFGFQKPIMFPYLTRLGTNFNSLLEVILAIIEYYNWNRIKLLYQPDGFVNVMNRYCHIAVDGIVQGLRRKRSKVQEDHIPFHTTEFILDNLQAEIGTGQAGEYYLDIVCLYRTPGCCTTLKDNRCGP